MGASSSVPFPRSADYRTFLSCRQENIPCSEQKSAFAGAAARASPAASRRAPPRPRAWTPSRIRSLESLPAPRARASLTRPPGTCGLRSRRLERSRRPSDARPAEPRSACPPAPDRPPGRPGSRSGNSSGRSSPVAVYRRIDSRPYRFERALCRPDRWPPHGYRQWPAGTWVCWRSKPPVRRPCRDLQVRKPYHHLPPARVRSRPHPLGARFALSISATRLVISAIGNPPALPGTRGV